MSGDEALDELFGAFDGDNDEQSLGKDENEGLPEIKRPRKDDDPEASRTSFAALMSTTTTTTGSSSRSNKQEPKEEVSAPSSGTNTLTGNREIATGTSHDKSVRSYSAYPKNLPSGHVVPKVEPPEEPAKQYPFPLDPFQQQAVSYIDKEESVLVAAHTSAGKTAVAEYAIAKSLKAGQRVVYTSPIKALSNQKFRDLQEEFADVGLMTGDITINPTATALVMTTEILRSMLYRGSEIMREVAWVIYDEVHYMRDSERGVVWEESIILLPHKVRFVFLSATIPNASQFADWIAEIHHQPCHVVYTNYRPTPLQHYIYPQGGDGLHLVVDERGKFREANFQKAMATLQSSSNMDAAIAEAIADSGNSKKRGRQQRGKRSAGPEAGLHKIVKLIMDRNLNPVIVFSFSKKACEKFALALNSEDYTDDVEKDLISQVYINAIDSLSEDDQQLPQVEALLPLLKRGIGIHHSGLLPILKEIVEILFAEGLIKALFATETFAIGINMPAKTVVFTNTRKWDGKDFRWVSSGEYIQMSGRAGRRGKDDRGIVIQMVDEKMDPDVCKDILYGIPDPLNSSYRISYNMLLNLMRVEDVDPEYLLRASFFQYQREVEAPALINQAEEHEADANAVDVGSDEEAGMVSEFYQMEQQLILTQRRIKQSIRKPTNILRFLQVGGRLLEISIEGENFGWGALVSCKKKQGTGAGGSAGRMAAMTAGPDYTVDVLLPCMDRHFDDQNSKGKDEDSEDNKLIWRGNFQTCRPARKDDRSSLVSLRIFTVGLENIENISAARIFIPQDCTTVESRRTVQSTLKEVKSRFKDGVPLLDPVKDMGIKEESFQTLLDRASTLADRMATHKLTSEITEEKRNELVAAFEKKEDLRNQAKLLREKARSFQTIALKDDMRKMKRVLKRLGHVDANGVIQTKGRTACEINTAHELVVVELIFGGIFNELSVEQCVALLSSMTFTEKNSDDDDPASKLQSFLSRPFYKLQEVARTVARIEASCGVDVKEEEFVDSFNPGMMEAVYAWCKGAKFIKVQQLTAAYEGTTIRTLRRLEELIRQITVAAKAIGNTELEAKFGKGSELIKRDIVFCSSLYL